MKRNLSLLIAAAILSLATTVMAADTNQSNQPVANKYVLGVHGLSCPFCAIGIKKTFKKISGVQSVEVSLKSHTVTVNIDSGVCFTDHELKKIFNKTGFTYHGIVEKPTTCP